MKVKIEWMEEYSKAKIYKKKPELGNGTATIFINQPSEIFESVGSRTDKQAREPIFWGEGAIHRLEWSRNVSSKVIKS